MKFGICIPHYGRPIEVGRLLEIARRAEERGFDSVWVTDHIIVPKDLNILYRDHMLDPLAVLPWLAGVTTRITLGTSVIVLPYRSPILVAKVLASVDVLSGGRLIFGAATGWMEEEFKALGVPFRERGRRADEALQVIRTLWTQEYPNLQTRYHRIEGMKFSPLPVQKPHPPIWVGGYSEGAFRRVARYGDGWHATGTTHEDFKQGMESVSRFWAEEGREGTPTWSLRLPLWLNGIAEAAIDTTRLFSRPHFRGSVEQVVNDIKGYQALGCEHLVLELAYLSFPTLIKSMDIVAEEIRPRVNG